MQVFSEPKWRFANLCYVQMQECIQSSENEYIDESCRVTLKSKDSLTRGGVKIWKCISKSRCTLKPRFSLKWFTHVLISFLYFLSGTVYKENVQTIASIGSIIEAHRLEYRSSGRSEEAKIRSII